jgi:hypothetical protein
MSGIILNDSIFEKGEGWREFYRDDRFAQRYLVEGELLYCETLMDVRCSPDAAVSMLQDSWDWWNHGRILSYRRNPDNSIEMDLKPIHWGPSVVHHHFFPPVKLTTMEGVRLTALLSRHFDGPATWDVSSKPGSAGAIAIRGRFHGVKNRIPVPFMTNQRAARIHLGAESGTLSFPFPRGTGWVGLYRRLEATGPGP